MGNIFKLCIKQKNENVDCPICFQPICFKKETPYRHLVTPCCKQFIHQSCWEKSLNTWSRCPFCNKTHIPQSFSEWIKFMNSKNRNNNCTTYLFNTNFNKEELQYIDKCFIKEQIICFTDDYYWNK